MYFSVHFKGKRIILSILILIFFVLLIMNYKNISIPSNTTDMEFKVVIDAGHGSIDTGTSYGNILEKEINLQIAKYLHQDLKNVNIIPILIRTEDKLYQNSRNKDLRQRPIISNQSKTDLFISIHANNFPSSQPSGSQIFYKINCDKSEKLAEFIQSEMVKIRDKNDRSLKKGDYYVLNKINSPGILIEVGFLSNPTDREKLTDTEYLKQISKAIKDGIIKYFQDNFSKQNTKNPAKRNNTEQENTVFKLNKNKLFYISNTDSNMFLIKNSMTFPTSSFFNEDFSNLSFTEIIAISAIKQLLDPPNGFISPIAEGTKINSLKVKDTIAILDISIESAKNFPGGSSMEYNAIEAITKTLLSIKDVSGVQILIDGKSGASMGGHIILDKVFYQD